MVSQIFFFPFFSFFLQQNQDSLLENDTFSRQEAEQQVLEREEEHLEAQMTTAKAK